MINKIYFSVIICCYNSEHYIKETINSVLTQTYPYWEIVIINDGSTDNTENIINKYIKNGINIKYFKQKNKGFAAARNKAIEKSSYGWIVIIDHDDICHKNRLQTHAEQIFNNQNSMLFFGDSIIFSDKKSYITNHFSRFDLNKFNLKKGEAYNSLILEGCFIDTETVVFNKRASNKIGNFNEKYKYIADYDFFLRMGKNYEFNYSKNILSSWRIHDNQATNKMSDIYAKEYISLLIANLNFNNSLYLNFKILFTMIKQISKYLKINLQSKFNY